MFVPAGMTETVVDDRLRSFGTGWLSSATDLARFETALGWGIAKDSTCVHCVGHTGGQQGTSTVVLVDRDHETGVVVLANMDNVDVFALARELRKVLGLIVP